MIHGASFDRSAIFYAPLQGFFSTKNVFHLLFFACSKEPVERKRVDSSSSQYSMPREEDIFSLPIFFFGPPFIPSYPSCRRKIRGIKGGESSPTIRCFVPSSSRTISAGS